MHFFCCCFFSFPFVTWTTGAFKQQVMSLRRGYMQEPRRHTKTQKDVNTLNNEEKCSKLLFTMSWFKFGIISFEPLNVTEECIMNVNYKF